MNKMQDYENNNLEQDLYTNRNYFKELKTKIMQEIKKFVKKVIQILYLKERTKKLEFKEQET